MTDTPIQGAEPFGFSGLEDALYGDAAGARVVERLEWVAGRKAAVDQTLTAGLTPQERDRHLLLRDAFVAAETILKAKPPTKGH